METAVARYHAAHFPHALAHRFAALLPNREVSLHVAPRDAPGDAPRIWRFQHYADGDEMRREFERNAVARVDLGAAYNIAPDAMRRLALPGSVAARALVFDVDIDAYDVAHAAAGAGALARRCCSGAALCARCWPLLACAAELLDAVLRRHLALARILYVFSGRRGVHVWVCDAAAQTLGEGARAIALRIVAALGARLALDGAPAPRDAALHAIMARHYDAYAAAQSDADAMDTSARASTSAAHIAATMLPRLDGGVTTQAAHMLRAPFAAHPANGGVALPMPLAALLAFDPARTLTARAVVNDEADARARLACACAHVGALLDAMHAELKDAA